MLKRMMIVTLLVAVVLSLTGCVPGDVRYTQGNPAGFLWGVWHGWIAPITLIWGLFNPAVKLYEVSNSGWWYDLGFYLAIVGGFGGLSFTRRRSRHDRN